MLRIAAAEDLTALTRLRRAATGDSAEDAAGWRNGWQGWKTSCCWKSPVRRPP